MADYDAGANLDTPIPKTAPALAWKAGVALAYAADEDRAGLEHALHVVGLDHDELRTGRKEVRG